MSDSDREEIEEILQEEDILFEDFEEKKNYEYDPSEFQSHYYSFPESRGDIKLEKSGLLMEKYLREFGISSKNLEVYNNWVLKTYYNNVHGRSFHWGDMNENKYFIRFEDPKFSIPYYVKSGVKLLLTPQYCRLNNITYTMMSKCMIRLWKYDENGKEVPVSEAIPHELGKVPLMVKSNPCVLFGKTTEELEKLGEDPWDRGGYFIVKGKERVVIHQEQLAFNKIILAELKKKLCCRLNCQLLKRNTTLFQISLDPKKKIILGELSSLKECNDKDKKKTVDFSKRRKCDDKERRDSEESIAINIVRILRLFGLGEGKTKNEVGETVVNIELARKEIRTALKDYIPNEILNDCMNKLIPNITDASIGYSGTYEDAFISDIEEAYQLMQYRSEESFERKKTLVMSALNKDIFPQVFDLAKIEGETHEEFMKRASDYRIGMILRMLSKILMYLAGYEKLSDRDCWSNKKVECAGVLMEKLYKNAFQTAIYAVKKVFKEKKVDPKDPLKILREFQIKYSEPEDKRKDDNNETIITQTFINSFVSQSWGVKGKDGKSNIVQILNRDSKIATATHCETIDVSIPRNGQMTSARKIQGDQFGGICPVYSSEGANCGIIKCYSIGSRLSLDRSHNPTIFHYLYSKKWIYPKKSEKHNTHFVFNAIIMGWCDGEEMYKYFLNLRRTGKITWDTTLVLNEDKLGKWFTIDTSPSRVFVPLLIVENNKLVIDIKGMRNSSINDLIENGCLEFVSLWEQSYIKLAVKPQDIDDVKNEIIERNIKIEDLKLKLQKLNSENKSFEKYISLEGQLRKISEEYEDYKVLYEDNFVELNKIKNEYENSISEIENEMYLIKETNLSIDLIIELENKLKNEKFMYTRAIAKKPYTHCMIDSIALLSVSASMIPWANHCQAPRNTYQVNMGKQAIANPHTNHPNRFDGKNKRLIYPTRPIVETEFSKILGLDYTGSGFMGVLAFLAFPFTEEDAFIFKKEYIESGASRMSKNISFTSIKIKVKDMEEKFMRPTNIPKEELVKYRFIAENGLPMIGAILKAKDCVIGKVRFISGSIQENQSTFLKIGEEGVVEKVYVSGDTVKVRIAITRIPLIGDKFSPRNAQKATIGLIVAEKDLPFSEITGIAPDMITNPHQIPSRMTISYPIEIHTSKAGALGMYRINGTSFRKYDIISVIDILKQYNLPIDGTEILRSGISGLSLGSIFIGPVFFQALKHHPADKIQARSTGHMKASTGQPVAGRNKGGGLRFGEMERDSTVSFGASATIQERLCNVSDVFDMYYCKLCGESAASRTDGSFYCQKCTGNHVDFGIKKISWGSILLKYLCAPAGIKLENVLEYNEESMTKLLLNPINKVNRSEITNIAMDDIDGKDQLSGDENDIFEEPMYEAKDYLDDVFF